MTKQLPQHVQSILLFLEAEKDHKLHDVAGKIISNSEDHISMWLAIEKREPFLNDDLWVWAYLESVAHLSQLPPYHVISNSDRKKLSTRISDLTTELTKLYVDNQLDFRIVAANGKFFNGFYILDDFSDKNKNGFENDLNVQKCEFIPILNGAAERATRMISESEHKGKAGKNAQAIWLVRKLREHHIRKYQTPLNKVLSTVSNSIFDTDFDESYIRNLFRRIGN